MEPWREGTTRLGCLGLSVSVQARFVFRLRSGAAAAGTVVRIFTEFVEAESAEWCRAEMDGRFFGGRTVRATSYDESKFFANDLGPQPGEKAVDS